MYLFWAWFCLTYSIVTTQERRTHYSTDERIGTQRDEWLDGRTEALNEIWTLLRADADYDSDEKITSEEWVSKTSSILRLRRPMLPLTQKDNRFNEPANISERMVILSWIWRLWPKDIYYHRRLMHYQMALMCSFEILHVLHCLQNSLMCYSAPFFILRTGITSLHYAHLIFRYSIYRYGFLLRGDPHIRKRTTRDWVVCVRSSMTSS